MDALVIFGLIIWAAVVVIMVSILIETGKWEDKKRSNIEKPAFQFDSGVSMDRDTCYERCMKRFLWNPSKESVCTASCGL